MSAQGYVILTFRFHKENRRWAASCEELGTATFAFSLSEAEKRLEEAVGLHLNTLEDVGERDRFFKEHNIKFYHMKPRNTVTISAPLNKEVFVKPHIQRVSGLVAV